VHFLSIEPMLGAVDLGPWLSKNGTATEPFLQWVIVGGESGHGARAMHPQWVRQLRDQVHGAGLALFFKQVGSNRAQWPGVTGHGADPAQWPEDLRIQEFPRQA
jgi:protein gp37